MTSPCMSWHHREGIAVFPKEKTNNCMNTSDLELFLWQDTCVCHLPGGRMLQEREGAAAHLCCCFCALQWVNLTPDKSHHISCLWVPRECQGHRTELFSWFLVCFLNIQMRLENKNGAEIWTNTAECVLRIGINLGVSSCCCFHFCCLLYKFHTKNYFHKIFSMKKYDNRKRGWRPRLVLNPRHSVTVCSAKSQKKPQLSALILNFFNLQSRAFNTCIWKTLLHATSLFFL